LPTNGLTRLVERTVIVAVTGLAELAAPVVATVSRAVPRFVACKLNSFGLFDGGAPIAIPEPAVAALTDAVYVGDPGPKM
jgi:hypothetical protein